jgi:hypothetical protein
LLHQLRVERGTDRGSEGLIHQTGFLAFAYFGYERGVVASGDGTSTCSGGVWSRCNRRCRSITSSSRSRIIPPIPGACGRPISTCSAGWPVAQLDVVVTDETHDAGFRDRVEHELPGIEEESWRDEPAAPPCSSCLRAARPRSSSAAIGKRSCATSLVTSDND